MRELDEIRMSRDTPQKLLSIPQTASPELQHVASKAHSVEYYEPVPSQLPNIKTPRSRMVLPELLNSVSAIKKVSCRFYGQTPKI